MHIWKYKDWNYENLKYKFGNSDCNSFTNEEINIYSTIYSLPPLKENDITYTGDNEKANLLNSYFKTRSDLNDAGKELLHIIRASTRENLPSGVCEQHRGRPACASAQSDQRLCYSRFGKNHIKACYKRNFSFLASLCS